MRRRAVLGGLAAAAVLAAVAALAWGGRSSAAPEPQGALTFRDRGGVNRLTIETRATSPQAGQFSFRVASGVYVGVERASVELKGGHELKVRYEGPADLIGTSDVRRVEVRLQGEFDLRRHRGEAKLRVGPEGPEREEFKIRTAETDRQEAERVLARFEGALLSSDWPALYAIVSRELAESIAPTDFAASAEAQTQALGRVIEVSRDALSESRTNPAGIIYAVATYTIARARPSGAVTRSTYDVYLVLDPDTWRVWFSAPR